MSRKRKIILFTTLAVILITGTIISLTHRRPGPMTGKSLDSKKEVKLTMQKINDISDSIHAFPEKTALYFRRAHLYRTINKFDMAIEDYNTIMKISKDSSELKLAEEKKKSCIKVKNYLNKIKN